MADPGASNSANTLPLDDVFDILKNRRRRLILQHLINSSEPIALGELTEAIATIENKKSQRAITSVERKRVYVALYQYHLPKMVDAGIINFEKDSGMIELVDTPDHLTRYLEIEDKESALDLGTLYLSIVAVGIATFLLHQFLGHSPILSGIFIGVLIALLGNLIFRYSTEMGSKILAYAGYSRSFETETVTDTT